LKALEDQDLEKEIEELIKNNKLKIVDQQNKPIFENELLEEI
jgi:hypothetical protein